MTDIAAVQFLSDGQRCDGRLYRPENVERPPVIVMGHGFCAEYRFGLPPFAERFVQSGYAVLLFDYRGFGDSEGQPRRLVRVKRQLRDWRAAIAHARTLDNVDADRLVLWGTSFSGGHVLTLAAEPDTRPAAIIAQVPHVDARAGGDSPVATGTLLRLLSLAALDALAGPLRLPPVEIPVVGPAGSVAMLNTSECEPGYRALIPADVDWPNRTPARVLFDMAGYRPRMTADAIRCPALVVAGRDDSLIPVAAVRDTAGRIERGELVELPCNHFQPYAGEWFERNIEAQLEFLKKTVPAL